MNKDYAKGRARKTTDSFKELAGRAVGDKSQESKGKVQKITGKTRAANSDLQSDLAKIWMIS